MKFVYIICIWHLRLIIIEYNYSDIIYNWGFIMLKLNYLFLGITLITFNTFGECNDLINNFQIQRNNTNNFKYTNNDFQTITYSTKCRDPINYNNHVLLTIIDNQKSVNNLINGSGSRNNVKKYVQDL